MIELALVVVEAEQQRADLAAAGRVAEPADHAVGGSKLLDLEHRPLAGDVGAVAALGDDTVESAARIFQPDSAASTRSRVQGESLSSFDLARFLVEDFERGAALD